jgi:hypothetical protein
MKYQKTRPAVDAANQVSLTGLVLELKPDAYHLTDKPNDQPKGFEQGFNLAEPMRSR